MTLSFESWLSAADSLLAEWDPSRADELDELVEQGLFLTDGADLSAGDHARLSLTIARVTAGLRRRHADVGDELDSLHRRRLDMTRNASGIAGYLANDSGPR